MIIIALVIIFAHTSLSQLFGRTADGIFETIIGDVTGEFKKLDRPKSFSEPRTFDDYLMAKTPDQVIYANSTHLRLKLMNPPTTTTERMAQLTTLPAKEMINITVDDMKVRMRKIHLNKLLERQTNPIPDFTKDEDNPAHITRRYDMIAKKTKKEKQPLRQLYSWREAYWGGWRRLRWEKQLAMSLMENFIYETRYQLPYVQLLRKKYSYHLQYKIGYGFALLRQLKQQQKLIYASLRNYYTQFTNLMVQMKLYEKIVRLNVDIKDLCHYLRRLNYLWKLEKKPDYYDDSSEEHTPGLRG